MAEQRLFLDDDDELFGSRLPEGVDAGMPASGGGSVNGLAVVGAKKQAGSKVSHSKRTRDYYARRGYLIAACETRDAHWNGQVVEAGATHDLFTLFDFIAFNEREMVGVQECKPSVVQNHIRKMAGADTTNRVSGPLSVGGKGEAYEIAQITLAWLASPHRRIEIISWEERTPVGAKKFFEEIRQVTAQDIELTISRRRKK
jgi:hypothetical protein